MMGLTIFPSVRYVSSGLTDPVPLKQVLVLELDRNKARKILPRCVRLRESVACEFFLYAHQGNDLEYRLTERIDHRFGGVSGYL